MRAQAARTHRSAVKEKLALVQQNTMSSTPISTSGRAALGAASHNRAEPSSVAVLPSSDCMRRMT